MPTIRQITVYRLDELSPKAKEKAIEKERQDLHELFSGESLTELFTDQLKEKGLPYDDIRWSLSSSQGDGVAFYGQIKFKDWLEKGGLDLLDKRNRSFAQRLADQYSLNIVIAKRGEFHQYDHWNTMRVEISADRTLTAREHAAMMDVDSKMTNQIVEMSRDLEKLGYDEIESQTSEEAAIESINANEMEFDERGNRV